MTGRNRHLAVKARNFPEFEHIAAGVQIINVQRSYLSNL